MPATQDIEDTKKVEVTLVTDVRMKPEDMGQKQGLAEVVKAGTVIKVSRVMANLLCANKQAEPGRVDLKKTK
jgi:hypothetical protein